MGNSKAKSADRVITNRQQWEAIASAGPLRRFVAIGNRLPGVKPVRKFTSRQIALERIWRVIAGAEPARRNTAVKPGSRQPAFRESSKAAQSYALLLRREGVTLGELEQLTGWQRHTIRGFLSSIAHKQAAECDRFDVGANV